MIELVTFDWNGTLLADTQACMDIGNLQIKKFGGTPLSRKQYLAEFDFPVIDFFCNQGCDREALLKPEALTFFHGLYEPRAMKCRTRRGARKVLSRLKEKNRDALILSNHMEDAIAAQLERLNLVGYIKKILANVDYGASSKGKNKIERMANYFSCTDHKPETSLIVGDSPEDVGIGKELGMGTIAITGGCYSPARLRATKPDYLITNLVDVIEIVENF